jgi:hypothetical protein
VLFSVAETLKVLILDVIVSIPSGNTRYSIWPF